MTIHRLGELENGQEADLFVLMTEKQELTTRDGKPYFRVGFRDRLRDVSFPVWNDSPLADDCRRNWTPGLFYKLRAVYRETNYGPQLDIRRIRETNDKDREDGFDPDMCCAKSRREPNEMFDELLDLLDHHIPEDRPELRSLIRMLVEDNREQWTRLPAARRHHHAYQGGLIEHTLSVTKTAIFLAERYSTEYPELQPPLDVPLVITGAALHDVGKLRELSQAPDGAEYTPSGEMVGHLLLGRDMVRESAAEAELPDETRLRLEHLIIAHQRLPEWGSPKPPMTPEALIVHYADDADAKFNMMHTIMLADPGEGPFTTTKNLLHYRLFRGLDG